MRSISMIGEASLRCYLFIMFAHALSDSGDISLDELKIGLSKLSIFMYPYELKEVSRTIAQHTVFLSALITSEQQVMTLIDKDGSGMLELQEMEAVFGV